MGLPSGENIKVKCKKALGIEPAKVMKHHNYAPHEDTTGSHLQPLNDKEHQRWTHPITPIASLHDGSSHFQLRLKHQFSLFVHDVLGCLKKIHSTCCTKTGLKVHEESESKNHASKNFTAPSGLNQA